MDSTAFPHILSTIAIAAASNYISDHEVTAALALRATCRNMRGIVDAHLFHHVAWKDGEVLTPLLRRLPTLWKPTDPEPSSPQPMADAPPDPVVTTVSNIVTHGASTGAAKQVTKHRVARYVRVLDQYSNIPPSEKVIFPRLRLVRCAEGCDTPISAPALIKRVEDPRICPSLTLPDRVRLCFLRWHPYRSTEDCVLQYDLGSLPTSLKVAVVLFPEIEWRTLYGEYLEAEVGPTVDLEDGDVDASTETSVITPIIQHVFGSYLYDLVARGGHVIFVAFNDTPRDSKWFMIAHLVLRKYFHEQIVTRKYGYSGDQEGAQYIPLSPEDEQLKENVGIVTVAEWRETVGERQLEWLGRKDLL